MLILQEELSSVYELEPPPSAPSVPKYAMKYLGICDGQIGILSRKARCLACVLSASLSLFLLSFEYVCFSVPVLFVRLPPCNCHWMSTLARSRIARKCQHCRW